jgi:hypothetical protein
VCALKKTKQQQTNKQKPVYLVCVCVCVCVCVLYLYLYFLYFVTFSSQVSLWNSGYSPWGEHGSDSVAPTQDIGGIGSFWWWRKPECLEETTDTWPAPKISFIRCNISSAASWNRTHTPHRHRLQACESDTSVAPWTAQPPRTPYHWLGDDHQHRLVFLPNSVFSTSPAHNQ